MKKRISLLLALVLMLGCLPALGEGFAADYAAMNEAAASVLILTMYDKDDKELGKASGFMVFDDRHAVTTWLAISSAARIEVETDEGKKLGAFKVLGCDSACNLAILAFDESTGLQPLVLNETGDVRRGAACVSIGAQNGVNSISTGNIATFFRVQGFDLIQFTAPISEGASGGALLDEEGKVAAVTMFGISGEIGYTVVQNMNFALSIHHLMDVWAFCKEDEPVELKDWRVTDINPENPQDAINELKNGTMITLENETGYSVTDFRVQIGGQSKICSLDGWFKDGETAKLDLKKLGDKEGRSVKVSFYVRTKTGGARGCAYAGEFQLGDLWGKTYKLEVHPGNTESGFVPTFTCVKADSPEQRHVKEVAETEEDFTIPEVIERKPNLPANTCLLINDTKKEFKLITISDNKGMLYKLSVETVAPGAYLIVEMPESFVNSNDGGNWKFRVYLKLYTEMAHMDVTDPDDVLGKIFYVRQKEKSYYFEAQ